MPRVDTANLISISEATRRGVSKLANEAANGREQILMRNNKPVAAVVGMDRLAELDELERLEEDLFDITLATTRMLTDDGKRPVSTRCSSTSATLEKTCVSRPSRCRFALSLLSRRSRT